MNYNENDLALFNYVLEQMKDKPTMEFDFNDPKQYAFTQMIHQKSWDPKRYPGLYKALEQQKQQHQSDGFVTTFSTDTPGFVPAFPVTSIGFTDYTNSAIAANAYGTVPGGYSNINLTLIIKDNATGNILASAPANQLAGELLPVAIPPFASTNANISAYLVYSATPANGGSYLSGISQLPGYGAAADPVVTQPVGGCTQPFTPNAINIGVGRNWGDPQLGIKLDYIFPQPVNIQNPVGRIPFAGSVIFNNPIVALQPGTNFLLNISVANDTGGGTISLPATNLQTVYQAFSIDATNPNKLNWSLPGGTSAANPGNPITFGNVPWPTDISAFFFCQIIVTVNLGNGETGFASANVQSELTPDPNPNDGTTYIWPVSFVWHCLGENTTISMADGSVKPIADMKAGDLVLTGKGKETAKVAFTNRGRHIGSVLNLLTANGQNIITSHNHLFMTSSGFVQAQGLRVGDTLVATEGQTKVKSIEVIENYEGLMYNFGLETGPGKQDTYVANQLVVGDMNAQTTHRKQLKKDIRWVKQQVPESFHKDVESYFEDLAKS